MKLSGVGWPRKRPSALSGLRVTGYGLLQRRILRQRPCVLYEGQQQLARLFGQDLVRRVLEPLEVLVGRVDAVEPFAGDVRVDAAVVAAGEDDQRAAQAGMAAEVQAEHVGEQEILRPAVAVVGARGLLVAVLG